VVLQAHTVTNPYTMVVDFQRALLANLTMFSSWGDKLLATVAIGKLAILWHFS